MPFDVRILSTVNLVLQSLLVVALMAAVYLVRKKRDLKIHCLIIRIAVPLQVIAILGVMLPSMFGYIGNEQTSLFMAIEILAHHTLGLVVIALWVYVSILFRRGAGSLPRMVTAMKVAFWLWLVVFLVGLHIYLTRWV
ncbi:MAG: hypothetical protein HW414_1218 [Dehalococcoidia bacterium]|nr:hypothetical protein [Dehalococcoidia bacterium]